MGRKSKKKSKRIATATVKGSKVSIKKATRVTERVLIAYFDVSKLTDPELQRFHAALTGTDAEHRAGRVGEDVPADATFSLRETELENDMVVAMSDRDYPPSAKDDGACPTCPKCKVKWNDEVKYYYDQAIVITESLQAHHRVTVEDGEIRMVSAWEDTSRGISEGDGDYKALCNGCGHIGDLASFGIPDGEWDWS